MGSMRDHIVEVAGRLFEAQGYHGTGINQIVMESGAPKGSLYHYFPGGKEEIAAAAIHFGGSVIIQHIEDELRLEGDPAEGFRRFVGLIARQVEAVDYRAGGPLTTVALESASTQARLNEASQVVYGQILAAFKRKLVEEGGYSVERATGLALLIACGLEGAVVLSRTHHDTTPIRRIGDEIAAALTAARYADV